MLALIIISSGIFSRLIVHTPNFTPVLSLVFLAGMYLKGRQAIYIPLSLMVISDLIIGLYPGVFFTWAGILFISVLGIWLKEKKGLAAVLGGSMASAVIFFIVSNFACWLYMYPHTANGMQQCYILAIPFFRTTFVSTVAYSLIFYAVYEWLVQRTQGTALARLV